jgi:phospholipid/cholesterol/gamma-HCH transport system substrate-binding protein
MEYRRSEIGAGIFLVVSFCIVAVMVFAVSDIQSLFKKKKDMHVLFQYSDGIEKNAQVRYSGIKIGKVTNIRVAPEFGDKVELTLSIYSDAVIKSDTKAGIKTLGLVGGKYVELTGGTPQAKELEPGGTLIGEESFKLEDLTKAGLEVVAKLKNIANNLDRMLGDPVMTKSIKTIVRNLQDTTEDIKVMTSSKEEVAQGLKNLPAIMKKLEDTTASLQTLTEKADSLVGDNRKKIDETLENVKQITQNVKELTAEVKKAPWKLIRKP